MADLLYSPNDDRAPFALLFDTRTWTTIEPVVVKRFRGFTYNVPNVPRLRRELTCSHTRPTTSAS